MEVEPLAIRAANLNRSVFGYDKAAVEHALQDVADAYEVVWRERAQLLERTAALEAVIARHTELEELLRSTMIAGEKLAADLRASARREAEVIVADANAEAHQSVNAALRTREDIMSTVQRVQMLL